MKNLIFVLGILSAIITAALVGVLIYSGGTISPRSATVSLIVTVIFFQMHKAIKNNEDK